MIFFFPIYSFFNHILLLKTLCLLRWMLPDTMQIERRAERMFKHWSVAWPLHTVYINTWYTCTSCYLLLHSGRADKWILLPVNLSVSGYFTRRYHLYIITSICCMLSCCLHQTKQHYLLLDKLLHEITYTA